MGDLEDFQGFRRYFENELNRLEAADIDDRDRGAIAPNTLRRDLRILAERANVDKPVNPHNFRHSAITRMVREGYTRTEIEHRVHWTLDTDMWERYVHLEAEQVNDDIWARAGQGEADGGPTAARKQCTNCMETMPPESDFCPFCTAPANRRGRLVERAVIRLLTSRLRSADDEAAAQGYDRLLNDVLSGDADLSTIDVSDHDELASLLSASE